MAYRELHGRLKLAKQQVRMYRQAMEHLMAAPQSSPEVEGQARVTLTDVSPANKTNRNRKGHPYGESHSVVDSEVTANLSTYSSDASEAAALGGDADEDVHVTDGSNPRRSTGDPSRTESSVGSITGRKPGCPAPLDSTRDSVTFPEEMQKIVERRARVWRERELLARTRAELARCRGELLLRGVALDAKRSDLAEARESCRSRKALYSEQLVCAMNMGALNDSFHIWHQGPFATINGFRVGRLDTHAVDWQEVNAGVGQAAIVLVTVAMSMGVQFSKYLIAPCGSFTKIARSEDGRVLYNLHTDESFSFFPRRNFNYALKAFLHCLGEVGGYVQEHDPTLQLPYEIKEKDGTVGDLPVALGSSLEDWTRALKYMITDLKWIAAWAAKYLPPC